MEIYLVNHGESIGQVKSIIQGHQGGELTEQGLYQSRLLAIRLSKIKFKEIYSSDLNRAQETLKQILEFHNDTPVFVSEKFREKAGGELEGSSSSEYKIKAKESKTHIRMYKPEGGESWFDMFKRVKGVLDDFILKGIKTDYKVPEIVERKFVKKVTSDVADVVLSTEQKSGALPFRKMETQSVKMDIKERLDPNYKPTIKVREPPKQGGPQIQMKQTATVNAVRGGGFGGTASATENAGNSSQVNNNDVSLSFYRSPTVVLDKYQNNLQSLLGDREFHKTLVKPYKGYSEDTKSARILILTHQGFIMEFLNTILIRQGLKIRFVNDAKNTGLYVINIYCGNCGFVCKSNGDERCKLEFDTILANDTSHLGVEKTEGYSF